MKSLPAVALVVFALLLSCAGIHAGDFVDKLQFGSPGSESAHQFSGLQSEKIAVGLGEPARRLLPPPTNNWEGGQMSFTLQVDPARQNYATLRHGNYLTGMNMTTDRTFELKPPAGVSEARELVSGKTVKLSAPLKAGLRSTVVLWFGKN